MERDRDQKETAGVEATTIQRYRARVLWYVAFILSYFGFSLLYLRIVVYISIYSV